MARSTRRCRCRAAATLLAAAVSLAATVDRTEATPPVQVRVQGGVLGPSDLGLVFLSDIPVAASDGSGVTTRGGVFAFTATFTGFPLTVTAQIDGTSVRSMATTFSSNGVVNVNIDPTSEAAVRRLEAIGLDRFAISGVESVIGAYLSANASSRFDGIDITQAIDLAEQVAEADPNVQRAIEEALIEPICDGDCDIDGLVTVNELVTAVNIALGNRPVGDCATTGTVIDVSFLVKAIRNALVGCAVT